MNIYFCEIFKMGCFAILRLMIGLIFANKLIVAVFCLGLFEFFGNSCSDSVGLAATEFKKESPKEIILLEYFQVYPKWNSKSGIAISATVSKTELAQALNISKFDLETL